MQRKEKRKRRISNSGSYNELSLTLMSKINPHLRKLGTIYACTIQLTVKICIFFPIALQLQSFLEAGRHILQ